MSKLQDFLTPKHTNRAWWNIASSLSPTAKEIFLERCTREQGPFHILDVGCGSGRALGDLIDEHRGVYSQKEFFGFGVDRKPGPSSLVNLISGDATALPIVDNSIDFGYSYQTAMYVADTLRMLEEGYRVLKPGGSFCWEMHPHDVSANYVWDDILAATPGGDIFGLEKTKNCFAQAFYVQKSEDDYFKGFPFVLEDVVSGEQLPDLKMVDFHRYPHMRFCERGVYVPKTI